MNPSSLLKRRLNSPAADLMYQLSTEQALQPCEREPQSFWQCFTTYLVTFVMLAQIILPASAQAATLISDRFIEHDLNANGQYERVNSNQYQFTKAYYVDDVASRHAQHIASFQQKLLAFRKQALPAPLMIPIINDGITIIIPHYPLAKQIGDGFVQARFIRSQVFNAINRNLLTDAYATEAIQINALYNNAYAFSGTGHVRLGDSVTQAQVNAFGSNFIWPELRTINGEPVLVPIVHITDASLKALTLKGHTVSFSGKEANFNHITVNAGTIFARRNAFIRTAGDFTVKHKANVIANGDLNLLVGGTLQNLSGQLTAQDNVNILAKQYQQKTLVHRFATRFEQGTRLGTIASVNAINGNVSIRAHNDIIVQGGTIDGNNIVLNADGNIALVSQQARYVRDENIGGYDVSTSIVSHTASKLSASDSIYLMASGAVQINASTLTADKGVLQILAKQGIYITNEFDEFQKTRQGTVGKVTIQEQEFQTIAIQSALEAGKGVLIASDFGDITLRATHIAAGAGTNINAYNGAVNLLLAKEQDHYFYNRVKKGFWRIKTETITDKVDTAVYNRIVGGVKVQATHGVTLELGQKEDVSLDEMMAQFSQTDDLSWMSDLYQDPTLSQNVELAYQALLEVHEHEKTSSLSPAAMVIIAIAMSMVMPGSGAVIAGAGTASIQGVLIGVLNAGIQTIATQAVSSLANGDNIGEMAKSLTSSANMRSLATSMATAGALSTLPDVGPFTAGKDATDAARKAVELGNQAAQMVVQATVSAGISTVIRGGDFSEFGDVFVQTLQASAINQLGEKMAKKIGVAVENKNIDQVTRYLSHAALGCGIGLATANIKGSDKQNNISCVSGAGGAVVGEVIGDVYKSQTEYDVHFNKVQAKVDALQLDPDNETLLQDYRQLNTQLIELKTLGVNLARLGVAVGAMAAGLDVDIAASAAENAVKNNSLGKEVIKGLVYGGVFLANFITLADLVDEFTALDDFLTQYKQAPEAQKQQMLQDFAINFSAHILFSYADKLQIRKASDVLAPLVEYLEKTGANKEVIQVFSEVAAQIDQGKIKHPKIDAYKSDKASKGGSGGRVGSFLPAEYDKHIKAKSSKDAKKMSKNGEAQYWSDDLPENPTMVEVNAFRVAIEKEGIQKGIFAPQPGGKDYYLYDAGKTIGYNEGKPTQYMRVEIPNNPNPEYHGHPITKARYTNYLKEVKK